MHDQNESQSGYEEVPENHDGRTMILLAVSAAVLCGAFVAAGFFVFGMVFGPAQPDFVAEFPPEPETITASQNVVEPIAPPSADEPAVNDHPDQTSLPALAAAASETDSTLPDSNPTTTPVGEKSPDTEPVAVAESANSAATREADSARPAAPATTAQPAAASTVATSKPVEEPMPATLVSTAAPATTPAARQNSTRGTPLSYQWNPGDIQGYAVSMETTINGQKQSVSGTVELTCDEQPPGVDSKAAENSTRPETGTGTGFVVSAEGYLVTCAHVIQGADQIDVQIQGKTCSATVVAVEADDDLALLKIDAAGLTALVLADSSQVRLGEEVRAIGFPLSNVLGNGIKVTRGIVAGIVDRDEGRRFQIDAAVNPGNSGGPVVNGRGQVLGVASSKLIGLELTRVGFCVPAQRVLSLLKANNIPATEKGADQALDGPALVESVAPSVALITVTIGPTKVSGELVQIRTNGSFVTKNETNNRQRPVFSFPNMTFDSGSLNVDAYGNVESFSAPNQLPFLAGPMALLTIHQFDPSGRSSWTVRNRIKVTIQQDDSPFGRMRIPVPRPPRFGPRGNDPFAPTTIKEFEAQEVHQYRIISDSDDRVVLEKTFTLTTLDNDDAPYFRITGNGEVIFSRRMGLVESFKFDHHYEKNEEKETVRIPVRISVAREDSAVVASRKREAAIGQAKVEHENARKAANKTVVPVGEQLDDLLQKIKDENAKGGYPSSQLNALAKFDVLPEKQSEVEALLVDLLESKQYLTVRGALGALETWGTANSVPAIHAQLKHSMFPVVQSAIKALGVLADERSVAPLLKVLRSNASARHDAKESLVKIGKPAEESVVAMLFEDDQQLFQAASDILKEIGGKASVESLESIVNGKDFFRKSYAGRALSSVQSRVAAENSATANGDKVAIDPVALKVDAVLKAMAAPPDKSGYARTSALMQLGSPTEYKSDELEDALLKTLDDENFAVQHQGMMALQKRATERSIPRLLKLFTDPDSKLQFMAAQTLQKTGVGPDGERFLTEEFPTSVRKIQKAIVDLLTEIGSPASLEMLDELANAPQATSIQYGAARAAARIRLRADMPVSS